VSGQGSRIDAGDCRNVGLAQHRRKLAGVVEDGCGGVGHDQPAQPGALGLVVRSNAAVVADQRVSHHDKLAGVAGVGRDLLVAGLAGVHDQIALAAPLRTKGDARE